MQAEVCALDEEVRESTLVCALTEQMAQVEQANAQGCPAMHRITFWPELFGEVFAQMDTGLHRQIDEQCEFLARGKQQHLNGRAQLRRTQESEG